MAIKVFILGRPGSGKSTAARRMRKLAHRKGWTPVRVSDYDILYKMFQREQHQDHSGQKHFVAAAHGGFDVIDFPILDRALEEAEKKARKYIADGHELILIEFARDNYIEALRLFKDDFLRAAYFLFIDADIEACIKRVYARTFHPNYMNVDEEYDDHFVSDEIIRNYYRNDCTQAMIDELKEVYNLGEERVKAIHNTESQNNFLSDVGAFSRNLFSQFSDAIRRTEPLSTDILENRKIAEVV